MKLFNKLYLFIFVALAFACDPYEETFQELEENAPGPIANIEITLNDDDYALLEGVEGAENVVQYGNFDNEEDVREFIPRILSQKYPLFDNKSAVKVNYDFYRGGADQVRTFTRADEYEVTSDDYASLGGDAATYNVFTAMQPAEDFVPIVLADSITGATEGDLRLVTYQYAEEVNDPSVNIIMNSEEYQSLVDYTESERGPEWIDSFGTLDYYFGANSYFRNLDGRASKHKEWIANNNLNDNLFDGSTTPEEDSLRVEERMQEGIKTFLMINYPNATPQVNGAPKYFYVNYAVYYGGDAGTVNYYVQYQAKSIAPNLEFELISGPTTSEISSSTISEDRGAYYVFNGSKWEQEENVYYLSSADYDAMGAPGRFDNFSSSTPADDYLVDLLEMKYPYAQEENEISVIYKYYNGDETQTRGDLYTYLNAQWNVYESVITTSLQFGKEEGVWVPDNTIAYTLSATDYELIGKIEIENGNTARGENVQSYGNFYQNFPDGDTHWTPEEIAGIIGQFLLQKFPESEVGQKYRVTYLKYVGSAVEDTVLLILTEDGTYQEVE
ncbi:hypothetical protein [Marivirga sp.]|uniref:hypothetical protein n=1 Tax=Marivirga sp. TaxID=2018662 RepID=UPI0025DE363C|nr:hypothetical protein [Marivirga sp.]